VVFHWFACREPGFSRWPHAELIAGYDELDHPSRYYAEDALDELFDKTEAAPWSPTWKENTATRARRRSRK
jgi:hypothetical protein